MRAASILASAAFAACAAGEPVVVREAVGPPRDEIPATPGSIAAVRALDSAQIQRILRHGPLEPAAPDPTNRVATSDEAARLGHRLFFDTRLSLTGYHSCASCHMPSRAFADGLDLPVPEGSSPRHVPTVLNSAHQRWMFWDGRSDSLWSQALQPIDNPLELGIGRAGLARLLVDDAPLAASYRAVFGEDPDAGDAGAERTAVNAAKAIAAYEARLESGDSAFDRFAAALAARDLDAAARYPEDALRGLLLFTGKANCRSCHAGTNFSDGEFHTIGIAPRGGGKLTDAGRFQGIELLRADPFRGTGEHSDDRAGARAQEIDSLVQSPEQWGQLRTPSLRNVARTAPYMSQGQVATLRDVLQYYSTLEGAVAAGHHGEQVLKPLGLTDAEMADLEAFLRSLDGVDPPAEWTRPPPRRR